MGGQCRTRDLGKEDRDPGIRDVVVAHGKVLVGDPFIALHNRYLRNLRENKNILQTYSLGFESRIRVKVIRNFKVKFVS